MGDREELQELRRLAELEARASNQPAQASPPMADVIYQSAVKGMANLPDLPVTIWNLAKTGAAAMHPQIKEYATPTAPPVRTFLQEHGILKQEREPQTGPQRIVDAMVQAGVGSAFAPGSTLANIGTGLASGGAAGLTKEVTGSDLAAAAVGMATPFVARGMAAKPSPLDTPTRQAVLERAKAEGYTFPPTAIRPNFVNERLESIGGKAAVGQDAAMRNQAVTNALAARALDLPEGTPITEGVLKAVRASAGKPYELLAQQSPRAAAMIERLRDARAEASQNFTYYYKSGNPQALRDAQAAEKSAAVLEKALEKIAQPIQVPTGPNTTQMVNLVDEMRKGRATIAKTYDIEKSLNLGDASVDPRMLARLQDQGRPLTGELKTIAETTAAFRPFMREGAMIPQPGVSGTDAAASALLGTMGYGAAGGPAGLMAAGLPLLRGPARALALSPHYQRFFAQPVQPPPPWSDAAMQSALVGQAIAKRE